MEHQEKKLASLEALLFIHGEPLSHKKIASVLEVEEADVPELVRALRERLADPSRGIELISDREKIQLATKPEFSSIVETFVKEEISEDLTPASLEALSIIAYLGPISRARLEYLRGVNSSLILRSLSIRGLIERFPDPLHSSGFLYRPTFDFLKHLGIKEKEELPDFEKFQDLLAVFEKPAEAATGGEETLTGGSSPQPQSE